MKNRDTTNWYKIPNPPPWKDRIVYIIGGGKSLKGVDLSPLKNQCVIGINMAYTLGSEIVDSLYFHDRQFYDDHAVGLSEFGNPIYTHLLDLQGIEDFRVMYKRNRGISMTPGRLCFNKSSGGAAINLAAQLGARTIVLLGFDMSNHGNEMQPNWHERNAIALSRGYGISQNSYNEYREEIERWVVPAAKNLGIRLINANDNPTIDGIQTIPVASALSGDLSVTAPAPAPKVAQNAGKRLTVCCVWREAPDFPVESVVQLHRACRRVSGNDFRFVCLTDAEGYAKSQTLGEVDIEWQLSKHPEWKTWWAKLELFRPDLFSPDERVLFFDLDTAVLKDFRGWVSELEGMWFIRDLYHPSKMATGVMAWTGDQAHLYTKFVWWKEQNGKKFPRGSDQTWLRTWLPAVNDLNYLQDAGVKIHSYKRHVCKKGKVDEGVQVVCFHGKPRPQEVDEPWLNEYREGLTHGIDGND